MAEPTNGKVTFTLEIIDGQTGWRCERHLNDLSNSQVYGLLATMTEEMNSLWSLLGTRIRILHEEDPSVSN